MYLLAPVSFGGNVGDGTFVPLDWNNLIRNGTLSPDVQPAGVACLLYEPATEDVPSALNGIVTPTVQALTFFLTKVQPALANLGCPEPLTKIGGWK